MALGKTIALSLAALAACWAGAGESWREAPEGIPGAVLVSAGASGDVSFECLGYADVESKRRMTPDTLFRMASNTKGIAAAVALSVVAEGRLSLDDPVEKFFPSWRKLAATNRPTLRMLLSHTAGLPFFTRAPLPAPGMAALAERAAEAPLPHAPGTKYVYSNWGIDVAMAMFEKATGRPFDVEMRERIFRPLGMTNSTFVVSDANRGSLATVYWLSDSVAPQPIDPQRALAEPYVTYGVHPEAGGGLLSTPRDMARFFRMIAAGGTAPDGTVVIPPALMAEWTRKQTPPDVSERYSFGMKVDGRGRISHGGSCGTWGEADTRARRMRLFMVNVDGRSAAYKAFKSDWMKATSDL